MTPPNPSAADVAERTLIVERVFDAPRELVWEAWTDTQHARQWWAPLGQEVFYLDLDVRRGGVWRKGMRAEDGTEYWRGGVFREVVRPERLVFTYFSDDPNSEPGHETLVTVTLAEHDGKTKLTLHHAVFESVAARDAHRSGWSSAVERLGQYLSNGRDAESPGSDDLPAGLAAPARRALHGAGYFRLGQLDGAGETELLELHGMGRRAIETLRDALAARGMSLADDGHSPRSGQTRNS